MMLLIGCIILCVCMRRRRQLKNKVEDTPEPKHSFDFVDVSPPRFSPFNHSAQDPRGHLGGFSNPRVELAEHGRAQSFIRPSVPPKENTVRPKMGRDRSTSPESASSMRTVSQLLPEKPNKSPKPGQTRTKPIRPARPDSDATRLTVFEEDRSPTINDEWPMFPVPPSPAYVPQGRQAKRRPQFADEFTVSPDAMRQPTLTVKIPPIHPNHEQLAQERSLVEQQSPRETHASPPARKPKSAHVSMPPSSAASYLPAYYTSNDSRTPVAREHPLLDGEERLGTAYISRKPLPNAARASCASDNTSFESVDPEEPTPPEEVDRQLTPVVESPISGLRYPKVPRASNQAIPRSPPLSASPKFKRSASPERRQDVTLIEKRRGVDAAQDMGRRLWIHNSSRKGSLATVGTRKSSEDGLPTRTPSRQTKRKNKADSPLNGYGREIGLGQGTPHTHEMVLKSPLWEPKLTPSRRGEDLYITVC